MKEGRESQTSNIEHRTSNVQGQRPNVTDRLGGQGDRRISAEEGTEDGRLRQTSNIEHRTSNVQGQGPNVSAGFEGLGDRRIVEQEGTKEGRERQTSNIEHRTSNTEGQEPNVPDGAEGHGDSRLVRKEGTKEEGRERTSKAECNASTASRGVSKEGRRYDLEDRLLEYAAMIVRLVERLPKTRAGNHVWGNLLRSGTSPLFNHGEAQSAESQKDFIHKLRICLKELRESQRGLRLILRVPLVKDPKECQSALCETDELIRIFVASIRTADRNRRRETGEDFEMTAQESRSV